jgi:hypothetical protein
LRLLLWGGVSRQISPSGSKGLHPTAVGSCLGRRSKLAWLVGVHEVGDSPSEHLRRSLLGIRLCSASQLTLKPCCSPPQGGNHPSIGGSLAQGFIRHSAGAQPIRGDCSSGGVQKRNGCSPAIPTRLWVLRHRGPTPWQSAIPLQRQAMRSCSASPGRTLPPFSR